MTDAQERGLSPSDGDETLYSKLNSGTHQRPPMPIGTPALVRHQVYWIPKKLDSKQPEEFATVDRVEWIKTIRSFVSGTYDYLVEQEKSGSNLQLVTRATPEVRDKETTCVSLLWETMPVEIRLEPHQEYFTLTTAIDLSKWDGWKKDLDEKSLPNAAILKSAVMDFNTFASQRYSETYKSQERTKQDEDHNEALKTAHHGIYNDAWNGLSQQIYQQPFAALQFDPKTLGDKVADFHSLVISRPSRTDIVTASEQPSSSFIATEGAEVTALDKASFKKTEYLAAVEAIRPLIDQGSPKPRELEYTFSQSLDGRALLATALGDDPKARGEPPLTEVFYLTYGGRWSVGRHVDRANTLGTMRLAALYDLDKLRAVNDKLRDLERETRDWITEDLPKAMKRDEEDNSRAKFLEDLVEFSEELNTIETSIPGGVRHRVERSRYYRDQFEKILPDMHIERIPGWQAYNEFVHRKLGGSYDFIDIVGQRYDRIQTSLTRLTAQLRTAEMERQTSKIEEFQRWAEIGFFTVPFAYYLSNVLTHLINKEEFMKQHPMVERIIVLGSIITGIGFLNRERLGKKFYQCAESITRTTKKGKESVILFVKKEKKNIQVLYQQKQKKVTDWTRTLYGDTKFLYDEAKDATKKIKIQTRGALRRFRKNPPSSSGPNH